MVRQGFIIMTHIEDKHGEEEHGVSLLQSAILNFGSGIIVKQFK
jgi:hypothetical protein